MSDVMLSQTWVTWGSSGGVLSHAGADRAFEIPRTGFVELDAAHDRVRTLVAKGVSFDAAVDELSDITPLPHVMEAHALGSGITLIDDTATSSANDAVGSLKTVVNIADRQSRVIAVAGNFDFDGDSDYDSLEAFGAFMVRLNVDYVFAVGAEARALFLSVGREGSWDGESQHCADLPSAYDELRAFIRPGDVVIVMGSSSIDLFPLVTQLSEAFA